jgi:hypothetical protein
MKALVRSWKNESRSSRANKFRVPSFVFRVGKDTDCLLNRTRNAKTRNPERGLGTPGMLRGFAIIVGIVLAAIGGVIAYRALFLEPASAVVISSKGVRELPDTFRLVEGIVLLIVGAAIALTTALRRPRQ